MAWIPLAVALCLALHLGAIALAAMRFGIPIRQIDYGLGPTLLRIGKLRIKPLPFGGGIQLKHTETEWLEGDAKRDALDVQPRATRALIAAAGPCALLMLALLVFPFDGLRSFGSGFVQYIEGALSPFAHAQQLLRLAHEAAEGQAFLPLLALVAAKVAAFNLLPFPGSSGAFLLQILFERSPLGRHWPPQATQATLLLFLGLTLSWLLALAIYLGPLLV